MYWPEPGTDLEDPVRMDRFGRIMIIFPCTDFEGRIIKA